MLLLSSLGFLISLLVAVVSFWSSLDIPAAATESSTLVSIGALFAFISLLNLPSLVFSIRKLSRREERQSHPSLFKAASIAMVFWAVLVFAGYFLSRESATSQALAPITVLSIAIPVWWLIEFARRGLERPTLSREWGTLTIGLTLTPVCIMIIEMMLVLVVSLVILVFLGLQPGTLTQLLEATCSLEFSQDSMEALDQLLSDLAQNPIIAAGIFLVIGVIAPFTEELFKPLGVWLHLRPSFGAKDGYVLGLISSGAFALLESTSMVSQMALQDWTIAILLRSATGLLHIGLSGFVGYGIGRARSEKRWGFAVLYLLASAVLHGSWNSLALINSFSASSFSAVANFQGFGPGEILSTLGMVIIFGIVATIVIRVNRKLRIQQAAFVSEDNNES